MSIQWAIDTMAKHNNYYGYIGERIGNADARRCDKEVKYCKKCNRCWESVRLSNDIDIEHYSDFEKLGKEKKICPICRKVKKAGNHTSLAGSSHPWLSCKIFRGEMK